MFAKYSTLYNNTQKNSTAVRQILLLQLTSNVRKNNTFFCRVNFLPNKIRRLAGNAKTFLKTPLCASFKLSRQMQRGKTTHNFTVTFLQYTAEKCLPDFSQSAMHVAVVLPRAMHKSKSTKLYNKKDGRVAVFSVVKLLVVFFHHCESNCRGCGVALCDRVELHNAYGACTQREHIFAQNIGNGPTCCR